MVNLKDRRQPSTQENLAETFFDSDNDVVDVETICSDHNMKSDYNNNN